jgi:putative lipoprotein (rSAM/lipoprotein system)
MQGEIIMAHRIRYFSTWTLRSVLRVMNAAMAVVLSLFCFVTGQTRRAADNSTTSSVIEPDAFAPPLYGIDPLYGPIAEYGMPSADYRFMGTVAAQSDSSGIADAKVYLYVSDELQPRDSATTDEDGSYSVEAIGSFPGNPLRIEVKDGDGADNGAYMGKDTVITIPNDSLGGGSGWYSGSAETTVDLYLAADTTTDIRRKSTAHEPSAARPLQVRRSGNIIRVGITGLAPNADVNGIIADATGRTVWRFSGKANSEFAFSSRGLAAGCYTASVRCGKSRFSARMELQ